MAAAGVPGAHPGQPGSVPCTTDPDPLADPPVTGGPAGCTPTRQTLFIPNVTTDVGLSPPYNSLFTLFGQFFDHGVDQTVKGGGTVFVPLKADDPLITLGPDHKANTGDEVPPEQAFMVLTRAQNQPGEDGVLGTADDVQDAENTDSPWVDQSQTYTSHSSHQAFLREYDTASAASRSPPASCSVARPRPMATPASAPGPTSRSRQPPSWGCELVDRDVIDIPMLAADPYGNFIPGRERSAAVRRPDDGGTASRGPDHPGPGPGQRAALRHPVPDRHRAQRRPVAAGHRPQPGHAAGGSDPDADNTASADFAQPAARARTTTRCWTRTSPVVTAAATRTSA